MNEPIPPAIADALTDFFPQVAGTEMFEIPAAPKPTERRPSLSQLIEDRRRIRRGEAVAPELPVLEPVADPEPAPPEPIAGDPRVQETVPLPEVPQPAEALPDAQDEASRAFYAEAERRIAQAEKSVSQLSYQEFRDTYNHLARTDPAMAAELLLGKQREAERLGQQAQTIMALRQQHVGYLASRLISETIQRHPALYEVSAGEGLDAFRAHAAQFARTDPGTLAAFTSNDRNAFLALQDRLAASFQRHRRALGYNPAAARQPTGPSTFADSGSAPIPVAPSTPAETKPMTLSDVIKARRTARRKAANQFRPGEQA